MSWLIVEVGLIAWLLLGALRGWQRGVVWRTLDLAVWLGSLALAFRLYRPLARWIGAVSDDMALWAAPLAFVVVLALVSSLLHGGGARLARRLPQRFHQHRVSRVLGLAPGALLGLFSATLVAILLLALPLPPGMQTAVRGSRLATRLAASAERLEAALQPIISPVIAHARQMLIVPPASRERGALPCSVADARARPDPETGCR